jgi:hypothetical protein
MSDHPDSLDIFFYDPATSESTLVAVLNPGEQATVWLETYLGHTFRVVHPLSEELLDEILILGDTYRTYSVDFNRIELRRRSEESEVVEGVNDTLCHEYERSLKVQRTFTPLGFGKGILPRDIYGSMMTYLHNNYHSVYIEDWMVPPSLSLSLPHHVSQTMFHVNWWEVHALMVGMPWKLKRSWQTKLRLLVEAWIGGKVPLENSDIYGMRRYEQGASLLSHVDREETHAVSMIINLEQVDVPEDWMVEIYDHGGRLHEIPMLPGEIIFYEARHPSLSDCLSLRLSSSQRRIFMVA